MIDIKKIYIIIGNLRDVFMGIASQYTKKKHESEDAVQMLMEYFLQMNPDTLKDIYKKDGKKGLIKYGAVALRRSFTSPRSKYYYTYKKQYFIYRDINNYELMKMESIKENNNTWELFEEMDMELDKLYWYDRELYKLYYSPDGETLDTLAKKTGISRNSLFTTIDNVRKHLKKVLSDE
tara:strand:- start:503 stop:1039 length:537 start_codon:yes stop_codon:yes gene_type:complete